MRKVIALVMTLCMILVLCACGQQTAPAVESTVAAENKAANTTGAYNIWVCDKSAVHQYHRTLKLGCEAAAKDLGVSLTYDAPAVSGDAAAQLDMFATAVAAKPDAICIGAIDQEAVVATMQKAKDAGIPIFCYDNGVNSDIPVTTLATNELMRPVHWQRRLARAAAVKAVCLLSGMTRPAKTVLKGRTVLLTHSVSFIPIWRSWMCSTPMMPQ